MHSIDDLLRIMARLRDPEGGCPWDQKQTYASILPYTLEEAYEVADAIERHDLTELRGELGDLLFQVVFYAQMASEEGAFDFPAVVDGICAKMIRRHPHVFADAEFADEAELKAAWEQAKQRERAGKEESPAGALDGVALALPALVRAEKLQRRAARVGFDWPDIQGVLDKCREELAEVEQALEGYDTRALEAEVGDLLFSVVNLARHRGLDAEQALRGANARFESRFRHMESLARERGDAFDQLGLQAMDELWEAVKAQERGDA